MVAVSPSWLPTAASTFANPKSKIFAAPSSLQGVRHLDGIIQQIAGRHGSGPDPVLYAFAFQQLHYDHGLMLVFFHVMNGANVGMVQCGGGPGLTLKTGQHVWVACDVRRQKLESHKAMQPDVFGFVDHAHPGAA
jgi:hypothetical protein